MLLLLLACHGGDAGAQRPNLDPDPVDVETVTAETAPMPETIPLLGSVVADRQVQVAADTNGVVTRILVDRGDRVRRGTVLAVIDPRVSSLNRDASQAQVALARTQAESAKLECDRSEALFTQGVIPQAQIERVRAQCEVTSRSLAAAQASAAIASTSAAKTSVRAPFDGVVGDRMVEVGAFVAGASPILSLVTSGGNRLRFAVPERLVGDVSAEARVDFEVASLPGVSFTGAVKYISPSLREQTRDLIVEASVEDPDGKLVPGMSATVRLTTADREVVVIPTAALRTVDTAHHAFVVRSDRAFDTVVRVGAERDGKIAVLSDLAAGDVLVLSPPASLRDGQRVR